MLACLLRKKERLFIKRLLPPRAQDDLSVLVGAQLKLSFCLRLSIYFLAAFSPLILVALQAGWLAESAESAKRGKWLGIPRVWQAHIAEG